MTSQDLCVHSGRLGHAPVRSAVVFLSSVAVMSFLVLFQALLKSIVASLVLAEICLCQAWQVGWCRCSSISKRQLWKRPRGIMICFLLSCLNWQIQRSREHVAASRAGSSKFECTNDLKCWTQTDFILYAVCFSCGPWSQCCAERMDFRGIRSYTLSPLSSMDSGAPTTTSCLLGAAFHFPTASLGWEAAVIKQLRC